MGKMPEPFILGTLLQAEEGHPAWLSLLFEPMGRVDREPAVNQDLYHLLQADGGRCVEAVPDLEPLYQGKVHWISGPH